MLGDLIQDMVIPEQIHKDAAPELIKGSQKPAADAVVMLQKTLKPTDHGSTGKKPPYVT